MPRMLDKTTRIIDADFGRVSVGLTRNGTEPVPVAAILSGNGTDQVICEIPPGNARAGSFIQYDRVDLSFMLQNNESVLPVDVSVQRTSPVPLGGSNNGNNFDQIEEYIYVFTRPLNNTLIAANPDYTNIFNPMRSMGLDSAESGRLFGAGVSLEGRFAGWPNKEQCIFAEKRMYSVNLNNAATVNNGQLLALSDPPVASEYNTITGVPQLDSVTTWGSMSAILGPNLHVYRMVIVPSQDFSFVPDLTINQLYGGITSYIFPPVNVSFLCKDPGLSEGEYLTTLANQVNSTPIGGDTA